MSSVFVMAGGGTGGHVVPSLAVAKELAARGHRPYFIGTQRGLEAKLVPAAGFPIEWIRIGGLNNVSPARKLLTLAQLPLSIMRATRILSKWQAAAVFSMGGYVAAPVMLAARLRHIPIVLMEPNAMPGLTNRRLAGLVTKALVTFPEAARYFPPDSTEITGLPVREEFWAIAPKERGEVLTILVTGGSRGSRTINRAVRESWPLFKAAELPVRILHQTGPDAYEKIAEGFAASGLDGEVFPFIDDMPAAFAQADLVVCRAGAGAIAELAAAGKPSILVPYPHAANQHQQANAKALAHAEAALMISDRSMGGRRLVHEVKKLALEPGRLEKMGRIARNFAFPGAAARVADLLVELAGA